ncbi:MAG: pyruvate dehydrogenase (acetyl-transferring), homodimeric type, partial [Candidatus Eremiobacteraeota bacterium]|nr:pyruvate dehydrogenase (acetyl-transferring), homodimeric type [Candidatus Eremiobacteraeota bacterium]
LDVQRYNLLHPQATPRRSYVANCLADYSGPAIAASDYIKTFADQIRPFVDRPYYALGADGFGRSDYRRKLRQFFEVDRHYIALAALKSLADEGTVPMTMVSQAINKYEIDPSKPNPMSV